jgi:hypothetical protein
MTMKLELTPDVQARLLVQAQQSGLSLEAFAEKVLREKSRAEEPKGGVDIRLRLFQDWVASHEGNTVVLADDAMERESIYGDRGR